MDGVLTVVSHRCGMKYPLVYIEWDDHHSNDGWQAEADVKHSPAPCRSVGWLYKEDEKGVTIVGSVNDTDVGNNLYIVRSCITKYKVLRKGKNEKHKPPPKGTKESGPGGLGQTDN